MIKPTKKTYEDINANRKLKQSSMLTLFPLLINENGEYVYNILRPFIVNDIVFEDKNLDSTVLMYNEWWENISYDQYGFPEGWWMVALTNGVVNPFEEIDPGQTIYMLKSQYLNILYTDIQNIRKL